MRFLADQDIYALTLHLLRHLGHEVDAATETGLSQATDAEVR